MIVDALSDNLTLDQPRPLEGRHKDAPGKVHHRISPDQKCLLRMIRGKDVE